MNLISHDRLPEQTRHKSLVGVVNRLWSGDNESPPSVTAR
jgi:hypothetical protein